MVSEMKYIDYIHACNRHDMSNFIPMVFRGETLGWLRPAFAETLADWDGLFQREPDRVVLSLPEGGLEQRSRPVAEVLAQLVDQGVLTHLHGERYPATAGGREQARLLIDRAAAAAFGIRAFGQHLNGYVRTVSGLKMWVGRRSADRRNYPGKLDQLVAGGLPHGIGYRENLEKECWEEAGIDAALASRAVPVGTVTYVAETPLGLKPDTLYCYDLELPAGFQPRCTDGEVESFQLLPIDEVMALMRQGETFKLNCNLVIIDFLIRHGFLGPEDEDYLALTAGLHPALP